MFIFIRHFTEAQMAMIFCTGYVTLTVVAIFLLRPYSRRWIHNRRNSNDILGSAQQSFAAFYGILLALIAVEAYQDFSAAKQIVSNKAQTFATLYENLEAFPQPLRVTLQQELHDYAAETVETHWPKDRFSPPPKGPSPRLARLFAGVLSFSPQTKGEELAQASAYTQVNRLVEQRRLLLASAGEGIPSGVWFVVRLGAFLYLLLVCMLDMEIHVHLLIGVVTSLFLGAVVFLIAALDNPFRGGIEVDPEPIIVVRDQLTTPVIDRFSDPQERRGHLRDKPTGAAIEGAVDAFGRRMRDGALATPAVKP